MDYKEKLKKIIRPVLYTGLCAIVSLGGLGCKEKVKETHERENVTYAFTNFERVQKKDVRPTDNSWSYFRNAQSITTGDFDGDGDLDISVVYEDGEIDIYENQIPQKSK